MVLDNEQQKAMLKEIFGKINFPGTFVKEAHELMIAIESATIVSKENQNRK